MTDAMRRCRRHRSRRVRACRHKRTRKRVAGVTDVVLCALVHQSLEVTGAVAEQVAEVTDELVDEALAVNLANTIPLKSYITRLNPNSLVVSWKV